MDGSPGVTYSSYFDAYKASTPGKDTGVAPARGGSRPSTPSTRSYAQGPSPSPQRTRGRSPGGMPMFFSPVPQKTVSVLHRPKNPPMSMKNYEMMDVQFERDKQSFERHAAGFRRQAHEPWHHNGPSVLTLWEQGHIVDRGRAKTDIQVAQGVFDPILSEFRIPAAPAVAEKKMAPMRPQSAPHTRPSTAPQRMDKALQAARGEAGFNPITGEHKVAPSAEYTGRRAVEFERAHGGRGIASRASKDFSYNPITGDFKPLTPDAKSGKQRPMSAPRGGGRPETPGERPAGGAPNTPSELGKKRVQQSGTSWGTYNPIHHTWSAPPKDTKFQEPSQQLEKKAGLTGSHVRAAAPRRDQGVYNPITNAWVVPPANARMISGLSFAPATMFSRPTPATAARSLALS